MDNNQLSYFNRRNILDAMAKEELDLLVIGGGITGSGIAMDSASRGLKVGLLEKQDFAGGTSSKSTKLIHGGLRYLSQGEIKLVREVGRERAILYRNAPHIVKPEPMLLPLVKRGTHGRLATSIGLWLYDRLAGVKKEERRIMLSKSETAGLEPLIDSNRLVGGGLYSEYRTDDSRLTIEVIKTAGAYGALCVNYSEAKRFIYDENNRVVGVEVEDRIHHETWTIRAKHIVNATGPWVDQLREKDRSLNGKRLHHTKGVHLVVPHAAFPLKQSIYFDVHDKRMVFAIPRSRCTYIGTTDTNYSGDLDHLRVTAEDVDYLIDAVNSMFPSVKLKKQDILSSWVGLRPLIHEDGKSPSELSRKDEIFYSPTGLITIAGGKLTGFRKMAEKVVDVVVQKLQQKENRKFRECSTDKITLSGGDFHDSIPDYITEQLKLTAPLGFDRGMIESLVHKYGTNTHRVIQKAFQLNAKNYHPSRLRLLAEMWYTIEEEMVTNPSDFFIRRTNMLFFERDQIDFAHLFIHGEMEKAFRWTTTENSFYLEQFEQSYRSVIEFANVDDD